MSPCVNACGSGESGLSWLDGDGRCAACRPELVREPIPYLHQGRPPLIPLREMAAVNRDNPFRPPAVAVAGADPLQAGAETPEGVSLAHRPVEPVTIGGVIVHNVHPPFRCEGRPCVIHNPSDHHMADWPKVWRDGKRMVERTCEHGIGHPDPDDLAYRLTLPGQVGERDSGVHGCDGCCMPDAVERWMNLDDFEAGALGARVETVQQEIRRSWWARLLRRTA